jgi:hypothetical protein
MTSTPTIPPLTGTITVDAPVKQVFRTFTDGFGSWWPAQYHSSWSRGSAETNHLVRAGRLT